MTQRILTHYNLTNQQLKDGCMKCIENVQKLLHSSKILIQNKETNQFALGLYVYAIEEYGKAELLIGHLKHRKSSYSIPVWIFGHGDEARKAHVRKLSEAFKKLPAACS